MGVLVELQGQLDPVHGAIERPGVDQALTVTFQIGSRGHVRQIDDDGPRRPVAVIGVALRGMVHLDDDAGFARVAAESHIEHALMAWGGLGIGGHGDGKAGRQAERSRKAGPDSSDLFDRPRAHSSPRRWNSICGKTIDYAS